MLEGAHIPYALSCAVAIMHLTIMTNRSLLRRIGVFIASMAITFAMCETIESIAIVNLVNIALTFTGKVGLSELVKKFIVVCIVASGNWLVPNLPELLMLLLAFSLFMGPSSDSPVFTTTIVMWCMSFIALVVAQTGAFSQPVITLLVCILFLGSAHTLIWGNDSEIDLPKGITIFLAMFTIRSLVEMKLSNMGLSEVSILSKTFYLFWGITIASLFIRSNLKADSYTLFIKVFAMSLLLPFTPDSIAGSVVWNLNSAAVAIIGLLLMKKPSKAKSSIDKVMYLLIGLIVIMAQVTSFVGPVLSRASSFGLITIMVLELSLILRLCRIDAWEESRLFTRERLPQWAFLLVVFGGGGCLWYILNYVSQI